MRKNLLPLFSISLALAMPLPILALGQLGNGDLKSEQRRIAAFHAIDMTGVGKLTITKGAVQRVEIRLDSNLLSHYIAETRNGILNLGFEPGFAVGHLTDLEVNIAMPAIDGLALSGATEADLGSSFSGSSLEIKISGSGSIHGGIDYANLKTSISGAGNAGLRGKCGRLNLDISGAGDFNARDLASGEAVIELSGSSTVQVRVQKLLDARVSGAGSIRYWGDPQVAQRISGAGSVKRVGGF